VGKTEILEKLADSGALGIIRVQTAQDLVQIAKALHAGGLSCLEITMTTPGALRAIEEAREELPDVLMGKQYWQGLSSWSRPRWPSM